MQGSKVEKLDLKAASKVRDAQRNAVSDREGIFSSPRAVCRDQTPGSDLVLDVAPKPQDAPRTADTDIRAWDT